MSPRRPTALARPALLLPLATLALALRLPAQTTECVNLRPDGLAWLAAAATSCTISADGQIVAFATPSAVLLPGAPTYSSIYVRDRATGVLSLASVNSAGQPAASEAFDALLSAQGGHVAFSTTASNLDPNATNSVKQVFVHDRQTGATALASASSSGAAANLPCVATSISADGRFVVFETEAALIPADTNAQFDVYVRDTVAGTTTRASVSTSGAQSAGDSTEGRVSADGNRIAFLSTGADLSPGDVNGQADAFVRDLAAGTTTLASVSTSGLQANLPVSRVGISGDGVTVLLISHATTLDPLGGAGLAHVFARDLAASTTRMLDVSPSGNYGNQHASAVGAWHAPRSSHDGRHVVFTSLATNLVAGDTNSAPDVFHVDRAAGTIARSSLGPSGQQGDMDNGQVFSAGVSDDGLFVNFSSPAENMVAGDTSGGEANDVLVRDPTKPPVGFLLCTNADGAPCPCGGASQYPVRGCRNGNEATGLFASGEASVGADTLRFGAYELPHASPPASIFCVLYQGTQPIAGNQGITYGDGVRCVGGQTVRP